ncbi:putative nucleotidyltransferase, ribonuclease H [Tanacetum coccineum]|uniref:Nucleotidyltransferase, ribonuclease H n=1 Tax=Tanacetum coccineum TaxID=301880 RepID=A0ABQ5FTQ0_9ASTR
MLCGHYEIIGYGPSINQRLKTITKWPLETCLTCEEVRSFSRDLAWDIPTFCLNGFSRLALPLYPKNEKGEKFVVEDDERQESFEELKRRLVSAPILTLPSGSGGFQIYSDASKKGLGCVLMQHGKISRHYLDGEVVIYLQGSQSLNIFSTQRELNMRQRTMVKIEHQRASGLLQPLEIPMWKWDEISMDFVTGLPTTQKRHDAIWVVVDRLTKSAHFLPIRKNYGISKLAEIFRQEIVRLHGTPTSIVSDRDPKFTSHFWKGLQKAWGTRLKFSTAFHPQTDGQSERTIQTLEDMLRACALEWTGSWDEYLCLVEFAYNNSWHASIKAAPFELLYGRKCRAPICWDEVGERLIEGPELIEITNEKVAVAKEKLKEARSRQKSYADKHRRDLEFQVGDRVFLKVSPFRGVKRFGIKGKLSPRFIGPFEILERIGEVSYRLALPPQLSHVHDVFHVSLLRGYHYHPLHVASYPFDQIQPDMSLSEEPESILDRQERVMRNKVIPFVKILWKNHPEREATWETEESMRASYPHFFVRSRGSDFDIPVVFSLIIALLRNKVRIFLIPTPLTIIMIYALLRSFRYSYRYSDLIVKVSHDIFLSIFDYLCDIATFALSLLSWLSYMICYYVLLNPAMLPLIFEPLTLNLCYDPFEMNFDMTLL